MRCVMALKEGLMWKTRRIDNGHAQMSVKVCAPQTPTTYASNTYLAMDSTMERGDVRRQRQATTYHSTGPASQSNPDQQNEAFSAWCGNHGNSS